MNLTVMPTCIFLPRRRASSPFCLTLILCTTLTLYALGAQAQSREELEQQLTEFPLYSASRLSILTALVKACWRPCAAKGLRYGEEALAILEQFPNVEQEAKLLTYLPRIYQRDGLYDEAQELIRRGLVAARKTKDQHILASHLFNQAILYSAKTQFILAENAYKELYQIYLSLGDADGMGSAMNNLGRLSKRGHNYGKALEQYQKALQIYEQAGKNHNLPNTLSNIGEIYTLLGEYEMAQEAASKAMSMVDSESYPGVWMSVASKLADVYIKTNRLSQAQTLLLECLSLAERAEIRFVNYNFYVKLVEIALLNNDIDMAQGYYQAGLVSLKNHTTAKTNMPLSEVGAQIHIAKGELAQAGLLLEPVLEQINSGILSDTALSMLNRLIEVKKRQGSWQDSTELLTLYHQQYQQQVQLNRESRLDQYNILYKAREKERLISQLEQENYQKSIEVLTEQTARRKVLFVTLIVAILLSAIVYSSAQKRRMLAMQADLLKADAEKKRRLFSDISHELRTPLASLKLQLEGLEYDLIDDPKETYQVLHEKLASINHLITDISQLALADAGELQLNLTSVKAYEYFDNWAREADMLATHHQLAFKAKINVDPNTSCDIDPVRIKQVLQNLIANSCRYTDKPGFIEFKVRVRQGVLQWLIQDSSPGLNGEQLDDIFERLYRADESRSRKNGGSGLGLSICKSFVEAHNGTIVAEPSPLGGVAVYVNLPLAQENHNE